MLSCKEVYPDLFQDKTNNSLCVAGPANDTEHKGPKLYSNEGRAPSEWVEIYIGTCESQVLFTNATDCATVDETNDKVEYLQFRVRSYYEIADGN